MGETAFIGENLRYPRRISNRILQFVFFSNLLKRYPGTPEAVENTLSDIKAFDDESVTLRVWCFASAFTQHARKECYFTFFGRLIFNNTSLMRRVPLKRDQRLRVMILFTLQI